MTISLKHAFTSLKSDGVDATVVQPSNWNDEHVINCGTDKLLGRASVGTGVVEEIACTSFARTVLDDATADDVCATIGAVKKSGDTMTGNLSIISSTTEMRVTLGSSGGYYYGSATEAGWKNGAGNYRVKWNISSGDFTAAGNVTAYSDVRLKSDISTIEAAVDLVQKMRGVRYTRRSDGMRNVGVIAQEMQKVLPEVVLNNESGKLSVAYGNLTAVLIEAVKELAARVEELEAR